MEPSEKNSGIAIAALVMGILSLALGIVPLLGIVLGVAGIIVSSIALGKTKNGQRKGKGLAIAGLVMSIVGALTLGLIGTIAFMGVLSPSHIMPERTVFSAPLIVMESAVVSPNGEVSVSLMNQVGSPVIIKKEASGTDDCAGASVKQVRLADGTVLGAQDPVPNGEVFVITFQCDAKKKGDEFSAELTLNYENPSSGLTRSHSGSINAVVG